MNTNTKAGVRFGMGLSVILLLAGCNQKNDTTMDTSSTSTNAMATNAANVPPDNSGKNTRDRDNATLTPGDQGNSDADRAITQKIRQALTSSTNNYSMTAKNVKIITQDGKVTLRGPVNSTDEKTGIDAIAQGVAGQGNVNDQLEVKTNP